MFTKFWKHNLGSDPEFFFKKDGKVIGAEKVLPKEGMINLSNYGKVIIDGVQAELNPVPSDCRESHLFFIANLLKDAQNMGYDISFDNTVDVSKEELKTLSPECQGFGCSPSKNVYGANPVRVKDASQFYKRSAGGHIHLGIGNSELNYNEEDFKKIVRLLDILVGNTCVLIDRDENNRVRRENYGRAGEYRTPPHGLEYRTLSNFWLDSYTLGHFVLGMSRYAVMVYLNGLYDKVVGMVNEQDIITAINNNDFDLAFANFKKLIPLFMDTPYNGAYPLTTETLPGFLHLVEVGYKAVFPHGVESFARLATNWSQRIGFESWAFKFTEQAKAEKIEYYNKLTEVMR